MRVFPLLLAAIMVFIGPAWAQQKLTVYTYESFTAEWGPGPQVEKAFEAGCGCDLEFVSAITRGSVEQMGLKLGDEVTAIVKSTEVMVQKE